MATGSSFALRLPPSLMEEVKRWSARDASSINQFIVVALAEKLAALKAQATPEDLQRLYFERRAARTQPGAMEQILARAGRPDALPGDEVPEGWPGR